MEILENKSLRQLNTFGIDVKAKFFADVKYSGDLIEILVNEEFNSAPKLILGGGSNVLLSQDFAGLVIKISIPGISIISENQESAVIEAGAGVVWNDLVNFCVDHKLGGIENLSLIPGTVGAAPIQNIGAYGQELKDSFLSLDGFLIDTAEEKILFNDDCRFGYRTSIFKKELKGKFIVTSIRLKLSKNPVLNLSYGPVKNEIDKLNLYEPTIRDVSRVISSIRKSKLPDPAVIGNAGSFFKNPEISEKKFIDIKDKYPGVIGHKQEDGSYKIAAGWMIEECGWKGKKIGNTGTHEKQSLVLVNYGGAKGEEILKLAEEIKKSVSEKFGIQLTEEVNIY